MTQPDSSFEAEVEWLPTCARVGAAAALQCGEELMAQERIVRGRASGVRTAIPVKSRNFVDAV